MSGELKPCPFCGRAAPGPQSGAHMIAVGGGHAVRCPTCNSHGPECPTFEQAMAQWNQRQPIAQHIEDTVSPAPSCAVAAEPPKCEECTHCGGPCDHYQCKDGITCHAEGRAWDHCRYERAYDGTCGPEGRLFERSATA